MIRAVFDTNVLVSSIIGDGVPAQIVKGVRRGVFVLVLSAYILEETRRVMVEKLELDVTEVEAILVRIAGFSEVVPVLGTTQHWCADSTDNPIVETALQGRESMLVTGDKRFLATIGLPVDVITPTEFMLELEMEGA